MNINQLLADARWGNALYLTERYEQFLKEPPSSSLDTPSFESEYYTEWLDRLSKDEEILKRRVQAEGIKMEHFKYLIATSANHYDFSNTEWHQELVAIFNQKDQKEIDKYVQFNKEEIPFFDFLKPFLQRTIQVLEEKLKDQEAWFNKRRFIGLVMRNLSDKIFQLSIKTLIYELNKARVNQELKGETPKERYLYFVQNKLSTPEKILQLLLEYPVLARILAENVKRMHENMLIVLERLIQDRQEIESFFQVSLETLKNIELLGDSHNGGAKVLKLEFDNGTSIMYKPRDLTIDHAFSRILEWLNQKGINHQFKIAKTLNKGEYGWQEFISYQECKSLDEVERYFERQGSYIAILYAINATDMHLENIIAHGEYPFFIDLESLLHNQPYTYMEEKKQYTAMEKAIMILNNSVLKTSMLPTLDPNSLYHSDLSGLAGDPTQILKTYRVMDKNTDTMKIKWDKIKVTKINHLPSYQKQPIKPENYIPQVKQGFFTCYRLIMQNKEEFISLLYDAFKGCVVRTIIRPTISYFTLLEASTHPKYLKDGLDRVLLFDLLWIILKQDASREQSVKYECYDLLQGDVPLFRTIIGEKNLYHHKEQQPIQGAYQQDILTLTKNKILKMNEEDLELQWEFIERTVRTKYLMERTHMMEKVQESVKIDPVETEDIKQNQERLLKEAIRIGDYIKSIAIHGDDGQTVSWIGLGMDADEKLIYKASDIGLYNGVSGIAYFFLYLAKETGNPEYLKIADQCINSAWEMISKKMDPNISLFTGYGSLLYVLLHRNQLFGSPSLDDRMIQLLDMLEETIDTDDKYDIIAGCAGTLLACLDIYELYHYNKALEIAIKCGDHLVKNAQPMENGGVGWVISLKNKVPLSGIAHGSAGICMSLARLYKVTKKQHYLDTCMLGIQYENSLYCPEENNWKDLRFSLEGKMAENHFVMYWCNGAPGIGIARIGLAQYIDSDIVIQDIHRAIEKTMQDGFTEVSYSLCHGDMGNLELILLGADYFKNKRWNAFVIQMTDHILNEVEKLNYHWKCGIPGRQQIPGLMLGLAGIGYQLLRLYNRQLPSILMCEGPKKIYSSREVEIR